MKLKAIFSAALACLMLVGCGKKEIQLDQGAVAPGSYDEKAPLICTVDSREQAEEIAQQYGITLVEFSEGVACFYTDEDPNEVIRRGIDQGWPELSLNRITPLE